MWIRPSDLTENKQLRALVQTLLRTQGFIWYSRHRMAMCDCRLNIRIHGNRIVVYHTFDSDYYKTYATWTRMKISSDIDVFPIYVHITSWPPTRIDT